MSAFDVGTNNVKVSRGRLWSGKRRRWWSKHGKRGLRTPQDNHSSEAVNRAANRNRIPDKRRLIAHRSQPLFQTPPHHGKLTAGYQQPFSQPVGFLLSHYATPVVSTGYPTRHDPIVRSSRLAVLIGRRAPQHRLARAVRTHARLGLGAGVPILALTYYIIIDYWHVDSCDSHALPIDIALVAWYKPSCSQVGSKCIERHRVFQLPDSNEMRLFLAVADFRDRSYAPVSEVF